MDCCLKFQTHLVTEITVKSKRCRRSRRVTTRPLRPRAARPVRMCSRSRPAKVPLLEAGVTSQVRRDSPGEACGLVTVHR